MTMTINLGSNVWNLIILYVVYLEQNQYVLSDYRRCKSVFLSGNKSTDLWHNSICNFVYTVTFIKLNANISFLSLSFLRLTASFAVFFFHTACSHVSCVSHNEQRFIPFTALIGLSLQWTCKVLSESLQIFKINFSIQIFNWFVAMRAKKFRENTKILLFLTFGIFTVRNLVQILVLCSTHIALSDPLHTLVVKQLLVIF
jgi:hypothetical protein